MFCLLTIVCTLLLKNGRRVVVYGLSLSLYIYIYEYWNIAIYGIVLIFIVLYVCCTLRAASPTLLFVFYDAFAAISCLLSDDAFDV